MASRNRLRPLRFCAVMGALLMPALGWSAPSDETKELRAALRVVTERAYSDSVDVPGLLAELGLRAPSAKAQTLGGAGGLFSLQPQPKAPLDVGQNAPLAAIDASVSNFRIMLATLSQAYTGQNNLSVLTAQGARGSKAVSIRTGKVTLADLQSLSAAQGMPPREDGTLVAPVMLWADTTLILSPGDRLAMARDTGAFVLSMGRVEITGALVESVGPENPHEPKFAPFVTVLAGGSLSVKDSTLRGLGFGGTPKFGGLTIAGNPLIQTTQSAVIKNTLFDQTRTVTVANIADAVISGNTFQNTTSAALTLQAATEAQVKENLFRGTAPTNAIRVELGSDKVRVAENIFLDGSRVAVIVSGGSNRVVVRDNLVAGRDGAGVKFLNTQCGLAEGNVLIDNAQKGIEVRKSNGTVLRNNRIIGSQSAGIWISAQAEGAQTLVQDNTFEANATGLSSATGAEIWVAGNNFKRQLPKLLDGDISRLTTALVRDLGGSGPIRFLRGTVETYDAIAQLCGSDT